MKTATTVVRLNAVHRIMVILPGLVLSLSAFAQVQVNDTGLFIEEATTANGKYTVKHRTLMLSTESPVPYALYYRYTDDPAYRSLFPDRLFPSAGDATTTSTGIGLKNGAWYANGFLAIDCNLRPLTDVIAQVAVMETGRRGVVDFSWQPDWAGIRARFVLRPEDDKLFCEVRLKPNETLSSLRLRFVCFPGDYWRSESEPMDRRFSTAIQHKRQQEGAAVALNPPKEPWIFYFDGKVNRVNGSCALLYVPEQVSEVAVAPSVNGIITTILYPPATERLRFILWNFPDNYRTPEEADEYLKAHGERLRKELTEFKFD